MVFGLTFRAWQVLSQRQNGTEYKPYMHSYMKHRESPFSMHEHKSEQKLVRCETNTMPCKIMSEME